MTIINPNSIAGITSVTAEAGVMNFYKSDGTLAGLQLNGVNFNTTAGVSTFNNLYVGGTITYEDVKNVDSVGIITARAGLNVTANIDTDTLNVSGISTFGGNVLLGDDDELKFGAGNDGFIKSDGSNFLFQGSGTTYVRGSTLRLSANGGSGGFNGAVTIDVSGDERVQLKYGSGTKLVTTNTGVTVTGTVVAGGIDCNGTLEVSSTSNFDSTVKIADKIEHLGDSNTNIRFPAADTVAVETGGSEALRITSGGDCGIGNDSPNCKLAIKDTASHTDYANVTPSVGACMLQLYNNPSSEAANDHSTIQFGVNGGSHNRVNTISAVSESGGNRKMAFTFCTDEAGSRTEKMRITGDGKLGLKTTSPSEMLQIGDGSGTTGGLKVAGQSSSVTDDGLTIDWTSSNEARLFSESSGDATMHFYTTSSGTRGERLRITSGGDIGIGTDTIPGDSKLHLWDSSTSNYRPMVIDSAATNGSTLVYKQLGTQVISIGSGGGNNLSGSSVTHGLIRSEVATVFAVGNSEKLRINSVGNVSIGGADATPSNAAYNGSTLHLYQSGGSGYGSEIKFSTGSSGHTSADGAYMAFYSDNNMYCNIREAGAWAFYTSNTERLRITSGGEIQQYGFTGSADGSADDLALGNTTDGVNRGMTIWSHTSQNGNIAFADNDSNWRGAIQYLHADDVMRLIVAGGEKILIKSNGDVGIGENSPTRRLHVASDDDLTTFTGGSYGTFAIDNSQWNDGEYTAMDFLYNGNAKAVSRIASKITSSGASLHFGVSNNYSTGITHEAFVLEYQGDMKGGYNPNASLWDSGSEKGWYYNRAGGSWQTATPANSGYASWYINKNTGNGGSTDRRYIDFYWNTSQVGRIAENGSGSTSYGTSSDYRRKENLAPITDGITEVKKLKPYRFNFKTCDASKINQGFLAHEAQEVVPHAVSGTKDGMKIDERGDNVPDYQDMDYGQLTPLLTAALQEAIAEIETLKAEVAALKSA